MIPLRDNIPTRGRPVVVKGLILINFVAFGIQLIAGERFTRFFGLKPEYLSAWWHDAVLIVERQIDGPGGQVVHAVEQLAPGFMEGAFPLISSQFLHADLFHLLSNMLFLWIFADNVEGELGSKRFLFFYLLCGILAALTHVALTGSTGSVLIGASGAIAGSLGAYFVMFPRAKVLTLFPIGFIPLFFEIPAIYFLGLWFALQIISGLIGTGGMVAVWAHAGGFLAGVILVGVIPRARRRKPRPRYASFERIR